MGCVSGLQDHGQNDHRIRNWAAAEATVSGTHLGDFNGIPATGKKVGWTFMEIAEFKDGKLKALRAYRDNVNIYKQIGALPLNL